MSIVVGLDGSVRQDAVLRTALDFAQGKEARLILVRAVAIPAEVPPAVFSVGPADVARILEENATRDVGRLASQVPQERLESVRVTIGTPWQVLVDVAKEAHAELIVIGSHGYGGLDRLLGTTAAKVVNHAPCSVLVVR